MGDSRVLGDYEAVKPARWLEPRAGDAAAPAPAPGEEAPAADARRGRRKRGRGARRPAGPRPEVWSTRRAHLVSYVGLFLFTAFVFFRPYEHLPLPGLAYGAQVLAIFTLAAYFPAQLSAEGNLAARPREVNLALLLLLAALLSVPLAVSPAEAWANFVEFGKVVLMFVVLVNVVRTERRLHWLILLSLAASVFMSAAAINDYAAGRLGRGGRVKGAIGGLFENPNDLALHLVTMIPLAVCLMFGRRGPLKKLAYGLAAALFVAATVVTFSRGGFLGLLAASAVLGWKLGRKNRPAVFALGVLAVAAFVIAVPNEYGSRLSSIFGGDATGSATARQAVLWRSVVVALRYPIFGVGIGNFHFKSLREQVAHNSYTQVASEMGLAALVVYCLFIIAPLVRLRAVERETLGVKELARYYYLSVGLQASLAGYMVSSFFASVAHLWYVYHLVGYAVCLRRLYAVGGGRAASPGGAQPALTDGPEGAAARPGPRAAGAGET